MLSISTDLLADPFAPELEWPHLRAAILEQHGGIGPSPDWPRDWYPGDLYRERGTAPDVVAQATFVGRADAPPWGDANGDDAAMFAYLRASYEAWTASAPAQRFTLPESAERRESRERNKQIREIKRRAALPARGTRRFADLVAELRKRHGAQVDLSGLREEYRAAYESGERVTLERDGRQYRGTVGATRGPRPRFVLLLSIDL